MEEKVESITLQPFVLTDSLYTQMPGSAFLCGSYLVWTSAFARDTFLYITDITNGKEVGKMGEIGRGPTEFGSPSVGQACGNKVVVYDLNLPKQAFFFIDSLLEKKNPIQLMSNLGLAKKKCTYFMEIDTGMYIGLFPAENTPFLLWKPNGQCVPFGKFPVQGITNNYSVFQGKLLYNPNQKYLLYANSQFPYMALYERQNDDSFLLKKEKTIPFSYTIEDGKMRLAKEVEGFRGFCMTKDYIVVRVNEPKGSTKPTPGIRDMSRMPRKVYLYDYDLNLKKIVEFDMQVLYMVADTLSNKIYIIGLKNSYCIAMCEIP